MENTNKPVSAEWQEFLNGHWQREIPQKDGLYPTADFTGTETGLIVVYQNQKTMVFSTPRPWQGWFWSVAYPGLPLAEKF